MATTNKRIGTDTTAVTSIADDDLLLVIQSDGTDSHITGLDSKRTPLYTITGYTATLPAGETAVANYASLAAFEAAVAPTTQGERCQLAGWPSAGSLVFLEGRWSGSAYEWETI